ncbi:MAG: ATP-binding protein [Planctomycetota bacterium]|nr:ATP-binding protein [Planctomycetota bacterium]
MDDAEKITLAVPRRTQHLSLVRKVVATSAVEAGFAPDEVDKIELAVDEAVSNAILYAEPAEPRQIVVQVHPGPERFVIVLKDGGPPFPFEEKGQIVLEQQLRSPERGGLGIYIIRQFMDEVAYEYSARDGNVITMTKRVPAAAR